MRPLILGGECFDYCYPMQSAYMLENRSCPEIDRKHPKPWLSKSRRILVDTVPGDLEQPKGRSEFRAYAGWDFSSANMQARTGHCTRTRFAMAPASRQLAGLSPCEPSCLRGSERKRNVTNDLHLSGYDSSESWVFTVWSGLGHFGTNTSIAEKAWRWLI